MPLSKEEIRIRNLARYHANKDRYNERAKEYYKKVWYIKNRTAVLDKMRHFRFENPDLVIKNNKEHRMRNKKEKLENNIILVKTKDESLIVSFD
jgi:hypothetical protein